MSATIKGLTDANHGELLYKWIRQGVADYISSEGCSCCEGSEHEEHRATLAKLLRVRKYKDGSGYNFGAYRTDK